MRTVTALTVPITAVMMPLSPILAAVLFGFGAANRESAFVIGYTVIGMLIGLVPFSIYFILLRGWYSLEDTKTPFYLSLVLNTINVALSIALFNLAPTSMKVPAIGLAFGLTYWIMMPIAWPILSRRSRRPAHPRHLGGDRSRCSSPGSATVAAIVAAAVLIGLTSRAGPRRRLGLAA